MISTHSPNEWDRVSEAICLGLSVDFMACVQDVAVMTKMGLGLGLGSGDSDWAHRRHNRSRRLQERIDGVSTRLVPTVKLVMKLATLLLPFPPTRRSIRLASTSSMDWQTSHTHQLLRVNWRHCTNHTNAFNYMATPGKHKKIEIKLPEKEQKMSACLNIKPL